MLNPPNKILLFLTGIVLIILLFVTLFKRRDNKESYDIKVTNINTNYINRTILDEMNTDVGVKNIKLQYCADQCGISPPEKHIYDCQLYDFDQWGTCSPTGTQTRVRNILFDFGLNCPPSSDASRLQTQNCPVNCVLGDWADWNTCSTTCGDSGWRSRTRPIVTPALNGGSCPDTTQEEPCNRFPCPISCVVGDWESWSSCNTPCGDGLKTRRRPILVAPQYGGAECPSLEQNASCNEGPCCITAAWTSGDQGWEGTGCVQTRTRRRFISAIDPSKCPYGDLALEERNICDITLQNGVIQEGKDYTYNELINLIGDQSEFSIPSNTKFIIELKDNQQYVISNTIDNNILNVSYKNIVSSNMDPTDSTFYNLVLGTFAKSGYITKLEFSANAIYDGGNIGYYLIRIVRSQLPNKILIFDPIDKSGQIVANIDYPPNEVVFNKDDQMQVSLINTNGVTSLNDIRLKLT